MVMAKRGRVSKPDLAAPDVARPEDGETPARVSRSVAAARGRPTTSPASEGSSGFLARLRLDGGRLEPLAWFIAHERLWVNAGLLAGLGAGVLSAFGQRRVARTLGHFCPPFLLGGIYCRLAAGKSDGRTASKAGR